MAESRIKDENYFQVCGWMKNRLGLKGTKRDVFAIIYGFSQDGESEFTGSINYLVDWLDVSRPTIIKSLQELTESEFILKRVEMINNVQFNRYKANLQVVKNFNGGSKETLPPSKNDSDGGSKETLPNNKSINNKNNNNIDNIKERKTASNSFDLLIEKYLSEDGQYKYPDAPERCELLKEWLKVRKAKRAAMTDRAIELNLNKLDNLAAESKMSVVEYLKEVICRGWQAFFVIKDYNKSKDSNYVWNGKRISDLTQQEYEEYLNTQGEYDKPQGCWLVDKDGMQQRRYSKEFYNSLFDNFDEIEI